MGYSPWGHKELDMTFQLNNSYWDHRPRSESPSVTLVDLAPGEILHGESGVARPLPVEALQQNQLSRSSREKTQQSSGSESGLLLQRAPDK